MEEREVRTEKAKEEDWESERKRYLWRILERDLWGGEEVNRVIIKWGLKKAKAPQKRAKEKIKIKIKTPFELVQNSETSG